MTSAPVSRWTAWRWSFFAGAAALVTLGLFVALNPARLVLLHAVRPYNGLVWAGALLLLAVASYARHRPPLTRWLPPVTFGVLGLSALAGYWLLSGWNSEFGQSVVATSEDERLQVIQIKTSNVIDPVDELVLRSSEGLLSQRDDIGCFNADSSRRSFVAARFIAEDTVEVRSGSGERWTLMLDPQTVQMRTELPTDRC